MTVDPLMAILVVDDYQTMVRVVRGLLSQIGLENVDDAPNGAAALEKLRSKHYDLVISDWNMQPVSGIELLETVRADSALTDTKFIMVTAESKTDNVVAAKRAGVDSYIVKPFNAKILKSKIEAVCPH
jgi:two-component system chemotaxis response regulator CheY